MGPHNVRSPADRSHGGRAPQDDLTGWPITPENTEVLHQRQAQHVQHQFRLPPRLARTVAELHFGQRAA